MANEARRASIANEGIDRRGLVKGTVASAVGLAGAAAASGVAFADAAEGSAAAGAALDWLGEAPSISDEQIGAVYDVDALVCGLGTSGAFAAAKAAREGLRVLAIEQGSFTQIKSSVGTINNSYQKALGIEYDKNEVLNDFERYGISGTNRAVLNAWAERGAEAAEFYASFVERCGIEVVANPNAGNPDMYYKAWPIELSTRGDVDFMEYRQNLEKLPEVVIADAEANGAQVLYNTALVELVRDGDAVAGAIIRLEDGSYARVNAEKGVVLCTGGYASNEDMMRALQPQTLQMVANYQMMMPVRGDGIRAALWAGAVLEDAHCSMVFDRAVLPPDAEGTYANKDKGRYWAFASQPWLKVNLDGERFANESGLYESICRAALHQPGSCYCVIYDAAWREQAPQFETHGCSRFYPYPDNSVQAADNMDLMQMMMDGYLEDGSVVQADTLADLAQGLGIPVETFERTVARYNELCEMGADEDFGKEAFRMLPVSTPPFYGFRCAGCLLCTLDGLEISPRAEVLDADGKPIKGLYAAGNDAGGFYTTCYPSLAIGLNAGRGITFAYIAAEELARR